MAGHARISSWPAASPERGEPAGAHHLAELVEVDPAVAVAVDPADHPPALLRRAALLQPQRRQHRAELVHRDVPVAVGVEHPERLPHVLVAVLLLRRRAAAAALAVGLVPDHDGAVELPELLHVHAPVAVGVDARDHGRQLVTGDGHAQLAQRLLQLLPRDKAVAVPVEQPEHVLQLRRVGLAPPRRLRLSRRRQRLLGRRWRGLRRRRGSVGGGHGSTLAATREDGGEVDGDVGEEVAREERELNERGGRWHGGHCCVGLAMHGVVGRAW
uniref:Uncharacterized protein n=1 Tax=Arundo donax TaxID=35708 RepID=A0A0A9F5P5_ARUDO